MPNTLPVQPILRQVLPHPLHTACWSPSGLLVAVGGSDGMVGVVLPEGGFVWKKDRELPMQEAGLDVHLLAWSPDENYLAACFKFGGLIVLDTADGNISFSPSKLQPWGYLAWNKKSTEILMANDHSLSILPLFENEALGVFYRGKWRLDNPTLAARFGQGNELHFITENGLLVSNKVGDIKTKFDCAKSKASLANFSPSGRLALLYQNDAPAILIETENPGKEIHFRPMSAAPKCICVNESGSHIACGLEDGGVLVQKLGEDEIRLQDMASDGPVVWLGFAPTGHRLLAVHASGVLNIWDCADIGKLVGLTELFNTDAWVTKQLAGLARQMVRFESSTAEIWVPQLPGADGADLLGVIGTLNPGQRVGGLALSADGSRLYCGLSSGQVQAWNLKTGEKLWESNRQTDIIKDIVLSPDERLLACASAENSLYLLNVQDGSVKKRLMGHQRYAGKVAFSPDGHELLSASTDKTLRAWNVARGNETACLKINAGWVMCVAYAHQGDVFASSSDDDLTIRIWDAVTKQVLASYRSESGVVYSLAYSPNDDFLAAGTKNGDIVLRADSGQSHVLGRHRDLIFDLSFSHDGKYLASCSLDQTVRIWNIAERTEVRCFQVPEKGCYRLAWAVSSAYLVVRMYGDLFKIFDTRTLASSHQTNTLAPTVASPVPANQAALPLQWARLYSIDIAASLSVILQLQQLLTSTDRTAIFLSHHPGLAALCSLHWPADARLGLLALLLHRYPDEAKWQPPSDQDTLSLQQALVRALVNSVEDATTPLRPELAWLPAVLTQVDERLLTLLQVIGPEAIAADPGLPLRLLPQVIHLPRLTQIQHHLLTIRAPWDDNVGAQSNGGRIEGAGLAGRGSLNTLLPSQWAYPRNLLRWKHLNGGLLYRSRSASEAPTLPPLVIVLDTTPATFGPIEAITRPIAHALAQQLAEQGRAAVFLTTDIQQVFSLQHAAARLQLLTHRSHRSPDVPATLAKAQALRHSLRFGQQEASILLLTHCWWGAEENISLRIYGLRTIFVQYPHSNTTPPFSRCCERWESVQQLQAMAGALGRLLS